MTVIPFYGADDPEMFAIERAAMDRDGLVLAALDEILPAGPVVDVGAGDGFTAAKLTAERSVVALEPAAAMITLRDGVRWVRGEAEHLPFRDGTFAGAYATWAYFFSRGWDPRAGIAELDRVVAPGGPLAIVDNLGGDAFAELADADISADPAFWQGEGFSCRPIATSFRFDDLDDARTLLGFFFGEHGRQHAAVDVGFRVGLFTRASRGPA